VPYPFAHPAAVLPLARPMGRFAVPSALGIGSMLPDLWYFVPLVERSDSHSVAALFWFCVPAGLIAYALFHLALKQPLIALLSPRLGSFTCAGLPPRPWYAVVASLLVGSMTHVGWDDLTHSDSHRWLQHASTLAGSAILSWWMWRKLRRAPIAAQAPRLSRFHRACVIFGLLGAMLICALWSTETAWPANFRLAFDYSALRHLLRSAGIGALQGLGAAVLVYCVLFQRKILQ
jgi:hypothetical protein